MLPSLAFLRCPSRAIGILRRPPPLALVAAREHARFALRRASLAAEPAAERAREEEERVRIREEILSRKGRLWSDPLELRDEDVEAGLTYEDLPDWTEEAVSGLAKELVQVLEGGIPTLQRIVDVALPPSSAPHPVEDKKAYYRNFKKMEYEGILRKVGKIAKPHIDLILKLPVEERQDAVDELYEVVEEKMFEVEGVRLGDKVVFGDMVEKATEEFLLDFNKASQEKVEEGVEENQEKKQFELDKESIPTFIDLNKVNDSSERVEEGNELFPVSGLGGGIEEEWEMSALRTSRRVMLRKCMRTVAKLITQTTDGGVHVSLKGKEGCGKSTALNVLVASARESGYVVLFLPDGDLLTQRGKYIEPSAFSPGEFDLPLMAMDACLQLLSAHEHQLAHLSFPKRDVENHFTKEQCRKIFPKHDQADRPDVDLLDLLRLGSQTRNISSAAFAFAVSRLVETPSTPFLMVVDEYNTYFDGGQYYHEEYDFQVDKTIPPSKITLFSPFLNPSPHLKLLTAITHSRNVPIKTTQALLEDLEASQTKVVDVPRYSPLEIRTIVAHFESVGFGRLRFDMGKSISDNQELKYLEMLSGGRARKLFNACIKA